MISSGDRITVENGRFLAHGVVLGPPDTPNPPYPEPRVKVEIFRNKIDVPLAQVRLAKMSAQRPWEDAPREMLEAQLMAQAAQLATAQAEIAGLVEVVAMQCEAIAPPPVFSGIIHHWENGAGAPVNDEGEWFERLVDLMENYLVRQLGSRHPLRIADDDLRALVSHILD